MSSTPTQADTLAVLHGGQRAQAVHINGHVEEVFVRQPPIRQLERYVEIADDMPALVEFLCQKDTGWADKLADDSLFAIYHTGRSINDPRLGRWIQARNQTAASLRAAIKGAPAAPSPSPASSPGP